ncbi:small subunit processome component 20 homolog isoform X2 [Asterias amurensis]|uniref:small subunit processome component 20 homolog isoform X2 n=1 Tax=Asterias amurensis TaxID=7602 RepID=UPI003AB1A79C
MKSKSSNHRNENTYRFQTFSERISNINIDVIRKGGRIDRTPDDSDTFFAAGLAKWMDLNCTQDFTNFTRDISGQVDSFPQLVHHEEEIITALKTHLKVKKSLAYQPLLDLLVQLARDLQTDFYPHFEEFFSIIVSLLNTQDTELLENAFRSFGYLFKFLWRYLVRDIHIVFRFYSPLLSEHQKEHIRNFAAESFAFLMRKVKDHGDLFDMMLQSLEENPDQTTGLGRLLFEMIKSVKKQFHSCTEKVLPILLSKLGPVHFAEGVAKQLPWKLCLETLSAMFEFMAEWTTKDHAGVICRILQEALTAKYNHLISETDETRRDEFAEHLSGLVILMNQWVGYHGGYLIQHPDSYAAVILKLIADGAIQGQCADAVLDLTATLLNTTQCDLNNESVTTLIMVVFNSSFEQIQVLHFSRQLFDMGSFEKDVLHPLLHFCHAVMSETAPSSSSVHHGVLFTLCNLILSKQPPITDGAMLDGYSPYVVDFSLDVYKSQTKKKKSKKHAANFPEYLVSLLEFSPELLGQENVVSALWGALVCLPSARPLNGRNVTPKLKSLVETLWETAEQQEGTTKDTLLYVLSQASCTLLLCGKEEPTQSLLEEDFILKVLRSCPTSSHVLLVGDLYFTQSAILGNTSVLSDENLQTLFPVLQPNLSSPHKQVRTLTLRILSQFPVTLPSIPDLPVRQVCVFKLCLEAEMVPISVENYREKLKQLQKLSFDAVLPNVPVGNFKEVALRFLIGTLYVNFQLLWQPTMELIKSHAYGMEKKCFWSVYMEHLNDLASVHESAIRLRDDASTPTLEDSTEVESEDTQDLTELYGKVYRESTADADRPDPWNVRQMMWRTMGLFADRAEGRSRDLVPLLFRFIENEFQQSNVNNAPAQDIRVRSSQNSNANVDAIVDTSMDQREDGDESWVELQEDEEEEGEEVEETPRRGRRKGKRKKIKGSVYRALVTYLQLFSRFKDPKSMYKEPQLRQLYLKLLSSNFPDIQKTVLACLMTYNHPYLNPYKENLDGLMEDKKFRGMLVQFSIDETAGVVAANHREGLLPILMRILYGKMMSKTGPGTQGKSGGAVRRATILRFIAGSTASEMGVFLDLVLEPCQPIIKGDCRTMVTSYLESLTLPAVIPLKKQQSMLDTIGMIFSKLGLAIAPYATTILHLITSLLASYDRLLDQREQIQVYAVGQLKKLRQLALLRLVEFFGVFEEHPFSANEIDCIFEAAVWPQIGSLANECLATPTPLLKLILAWSKNPRFHPLFAKHHPSDQSCTVLPSVTALLSAPTVSDAVVAMVMEIVQSLLMEDDPEMEDDGERSLEVNDLLEVKLESKQFTEPPSLGTRLLLPHVPAVLTYLSSSVGKSTQRKGERSSLPMKDLNIISKISLYVSDPEQSAMLVGLLLPILQRTNERHETTELDILHTVKNVIKQCLTPADFLGLLSRLFYRLTFRQSRAALCDVFTAMSDTDPTMADIARLMRQLNSWDRKHVDERDYSYRLAGFRLANERLASMETIDVVFLTPVMYNCLYMIMKIDDMSMRDNSSYFLKALVTKLATEEPDSEHSNFDNVITHRLAPAIRESLRLKSENSRHEMIGLLSDIVKLFPNHPQFQCMGILRNEDIEKDFFENIRHIQHHRRMRALRLLALHAKQGDFTHSALYQFLLPMATAIIFDPVISAKNPNLVIEAIGAVGAVASQLPWRWYYLLLQQYLRLVTKSIDQQKTAVRLVVAVLDSFHFDLSLSEGVENVQVGKTSTKNEPPPSENSAEDKTGEENKKSEVAKTSSDSDDENNDEDDEKEVEEGDINEDDEKDTEKEVDKHRGQVTMATKIHRIIVASILPKLHKTLTKKAKSDEHHKKARFAVAEDDEILRVPIALAMVKLLQALPKKTLHQNLPNVLIKVCQMLKSRAKDVRDVSRDTLVKILASLGIGYFSFILKELRHALTRGYQLHVLSFTLHALLHSSMPTLQPGNLDASISSMVEVFNKELFGVVAEEKEVVGIVGKLEEARSIKGYDCYEMVAKVIGQGSLTRLILPLKEILETSHSHKVVRKASEVLKYVTMGLINNPGITVDSMLIFIHGLATETIPLMTPLERSKGKVKPPPDPRAAPESTYLLLPAPKKGGTTPQVSIKTNMYLIVEFGLQLLHMNLKRSKLSPSNQQHLQMLDPFVGILLQSLTSKYTKVTVVALRCVKWLLRYPLPSIDKSAVKLTKTLFKILNEYATAGAAKGANFDIVVCCFKAVTVLVRDVKQHTIDEKQLQVLLTYAEEDMHDHTRQATAFGLLKAIMSRKLIVPEMHDVMKKVAQLSITSGSSSVRLQCRQVIMSFLLDYPLGKKVRGHIEFFVSQLNFELQTGRESTLEMLATIFSSFPQKTLEQYAGMFFIPMATRLINDESAKCRKLTALAIKSLLQKIRIDKRDELFAMTTHWLQDNKPSHQRLASQLCGIFVEAEEEGFQRRLDTVLPQIVELIRPETLKKESPVEIEDEVSMEERHSDHMLFNLLSALAKMFKCCSLIGSRVHTQTMNAIWESIQTHLLHPHTWVRLVSAQLFGELFASKQPDSLAKALLKASSTQTDPNEKRVGANPKRKRKAVEVGEEERGGGGVREVGQEYPFNHGPDVIRDLVCIFCSQLQSHFIDKKLSDQVVRNLVFVGKVVRHLNPDEGLITDTEDEIPDDDGEEVMDDLTQTQEGSTTNKRTLETTHFVSNLSWMIRKMCRIASSEAAKSPKKTLKRNCVIKWLAAISVDVGGERLKPHLKQILKPMCREISDTKSHEDNDLRTLCQEALDLIKSLVGLETFSHAYADVQRDITKARIERKQKRALQAVADPVQAAKRKEKKHQNKKESKKRRIQQMRPTYQLGKRPRLGEGK